MRVEGEQETEWGYLTKLAGVTNVAELTTQKGPPEPIHKTTTTTTTITKSLPSQ